MRIPRKDEVWQHPVTAVEVQILGYDPDNKLVFYYDTHEYKLDGGGIEHSTLADFVQDYNPPLLVLPPTSVGYVAVEPHATRNVYPGYSYRERYEALEAWDTKSWDDLVVIKMVTTFSIDD